MRARHVMRHACMRPDSYRHYDVTSLLISFLSQMLQQLPAIERINLDHNPIAVVNEMVDTEFKSVQEITMRFSDDLVQVRM